MTDALIVGAIFLIIVLITQIGVRPHNLFLAAMPFVTSVVMGYLVLGLGSHRYASGDPGIAAAGVAIGVFFGLCLNRAMTLYRDPHRNGRLYTRGGAVYLAIWLFVLVGRIAFIAALEHSPSFAVSFGRLLDRLDGSPDGVGAFFLLMALAMSVTREIALLSRARRIPRPDGSLAAAQGVSRA
ncbi:hypothetical protein AB0N89_33960 [Amycolatopsis sp. NPDC089917]|uniref:hypothetical protein n=1 Tax=Amycolatopsis sp. NPDC089917 TaxID=3155187 RepID=UPI0034263ADF